MGSTGWGSGCEVGRSRFGERALRPRAEGLGLTRYLLVFRVQVSGFRVLGLVAQIAPLFPGEGADEGEGEGEESKGGEDRGIEGGRERGRGRGREGERGEGSVTAAAAASSGTTLNSPSCVLQRSVAPQIRQLILYHYSRVLGSGFWGSGSGFRTSGSRLRVIGFRVEGCLRLARVAVPDF